MFGSIGGPELLLLFVLALLIFGPRKLPEIGKTLGKTLGEFKRATSDFKTSLEREVEMEKLREVRSEVTAPLSVPSLEPPKQSALPVPYGGPSNVAAAHRPTEADDSAAGPATGNPGGGDERRDG